MSDYRLPERIALGQLLENAGQLKKVKEWTDCIGLRTTQFAEEIAGL